MQACRTVALGAALYLWTSLPAPAAVLRVAPGASVQEALSRARPGDTVQVAAGVYQERVSFECGGTWGKPVTLEGEPGAILDAAESVKLDCPTAPIEIPPISIDPETPFNVYLKTETELTLHTTTHTLYLECMVEVEV